MTDSPDPTAPKPSRKKPSRRPATIDLKPTVIDEGIRPDETAATEAPHEAVSRPGGTPGADAPGTGAREADTLGTDTLSAAPETGLPGEADAAPRDAEALREHATEVEAGADAIGSGERQDPAPPSPAHRDRFGPLVGAGLIGGLLGAGIVLGVQALVPFAEDDARIAKLEQEIAALPRAAGPAALRQSLDPLRQRLDALEQAQRSTAEQASQAAEGARAAQARAQEALNRPVPAPAPAPAPAADPKALADLSTRVGALEGRLQSSVQAAAATAGQALEKRLGDQAQRIDDQDRKIDDESRRLGEQDQRLATLSRQLTEGTGTAMRAGTAVILTDRLNEALGNGTPYADILDGLRKVRGNADLGALEPFAQKGAPTAAQLAESFRPVGDAIIRDSRSGADGLSDRLLRMMDRVVTVRPVSEPGSTGVPSLVARIEDALDRGDVEGAVSAWDSLPEPSRRLSEEWGRQAKQRAAAAAAAKGLASDAIATLNRTTP